MGRNQKFSGPNIYGSKKWAEIENSRLGFKMRRQKHHKFRFFLAKLLIFIENSCVQTCVHKRKFWKKSCPCVMCMGNSENRACVQKGWKSISNQPCRFQSQNRRKLEIIDLKIAEKWQISTSESAKKLVFWPINSRKLAYFDLEIAE